MRKLFAAFFAASLLIVVAAPVVQAAPTQVNVRIEGKEKTLFEGPIMTEGHDIRASSDTESRHCDGTNLGAHREAVPTPTAASVDAMEAIGQTFDGEWYEGFDDYFITSWGPDPQDPGTGAYWGVLVNGIFTSVGGCQFGLRAGDESLWQYDAFSGKKFLWLAAATDPTPAPRAPQPSAYVEVGQPLALLVESYEGSGGEPHRAEGVTVAPVKTEAGTGFQTVETSDPTAVTTDVNGAAEVTFSTPGWHRLKAQEEVGYFRSNRLDVCVEPIGGGGCGPLPADAALRVPDRYKPPVQQPVTPPASEPITPSMSEPKSPPSNVVSFGSTLVDAQKGLARLNVGVPGAGALALSGANVIGQSLATGGAGVVLLTIKPTAKVRKELREKGKVRVAVQIGFTPTGGTGGSTQRSVILRLSPARK